MQVVRIGLIKNNSYRCVETSKISVNSENKNPEIKNYQIHFGFFNKLKKLTQIGPELKKLSSEVLPDEEVQKMLSEYLAYKGDNIVELVNAFNAIVKPLPNNIKPDDFFHSTFIESAENILKNGFDRTKRIQLKNGPDSLNTLLSNAAREIGTGTYFFLSEKSAVRWTGDTVVRAEADLKQFCFITYKDVNKLKRLILDDISKYSRQKKEEISLINSMAIYKEIMPIIAQKAGYKGIITDGLRAGSIMRLPDTRQAVIFDDKIITRIISKTDKPKKK